MAQIIWKNWDRLGQNLALLSSHIHMKENSVSFHSVCVSAFGF